MTAPRELLRKQAQRVAAAPEAPVPSPCASVCRMEMNSGYCEGCLRTLDEIAAWGRMEDGEKREVWAQIAKRSSETE